MHRPAIATLLLTLLLILPGCQPKSQPSDVGDPGMEATPGSAAYALMDSSGYLQCTNYIRAAAEAPITPEFKKEVTEFFTSFQFQLSPLIAQARKNPRSLNQLSTQASSVMNARSAEIKHITTNPQYAILGQRVNLIQNQLTLLTTQPLLFEKGFDELALTQPQREKISALLQDANKKLQAQQSSAFNGANLADLAEQTLNSGYQTRDAIRANLTPAQNAKWDSLAQPQSTTRPS